MDDLDQLVVGRQPPGRPQPRHVRVDRLEPALPGNRDPVVAVDDEVCVAQLVDDDRREIVVRERLLHSTHARDDGRSQRTELAVEVTAAAVGPHDLPNPNRSHPDVPPLVRTQPPGHLLEREEGGTDRVVSAHRSSASPDLWTP